LSRSTKKEQSMKMRCIELAVVLASLVVFGVAYADFDGVIDPQGTVTRIDSVKLTTPDLTFLTDGWGSRIPYDTFSFTGVPSWPGAIALYGTVNSVPVTQQILSPHTDTWYRIGLGVVAPLVEFVNEHVGVEESRPLVEHLRRLAVTPSVVTGQMAIRLQTVGTGLAIVEIHDAVGKVIRSLNCTTEADGIATAAWNREDEFGRLVPEGVYFCRYAAGGAGAVRKVLVTH
jgi:hypothetical protein